MLQLKVLTRIVNYGDSTEDYPTGVSFDYLEVSVPEDLELTAATLNPFVVKAFHAEHGFNRNIFVDVVFATGTDVEVTGITVEEDIVTLNDSSYEDQQTYQIVWEVLPAGVAQTVTFSIELDGDNPATGLTVSPDGLIDSSNVYGSGSATITITSTVNTNISTTISVNVQTGV